MSKFELMLNQQGFKAKGVEVNFSHQAYNDLLTRLLGIEPAPPLTLKVRPNPNWNQDRAPVGGRLYASLSDTIRLLTQDHTKSAILLSAHPDPQETNNDLLRLTAEWANNLNGTAHNSSTTLYILGAYASLTAGVGAGYSLGEALQSHSTTIQALSGLIMGSAVFFGGNDITLNAIRNRPEAKQIDAFVSDPETQSDFGNIITYRPLH